MRRFQTDSAAGGPQHDSLGLTVETCPAAPHVPRVGKAAYWVATLRCGGDRAPGMQPSGLEVGGGGAVQPVTRFCTMESGFGVGPGPPSPWLRTRRAPAPSRDAAGATREQAVRKLLLALLAQKTAAGALTAGAPPTTGGRIVHLLENYPIHSASARACAPSDTRKTCIRSDCGSVGDSCPLRHSDSQKVQPLGRSDTSKNTPATADSGISAADSGRGEVGLSSGAAAPVTRATVRPWAIHGSATTPSTKGDWANCVLRSREATIAGAMRQVVRLLRKKLGENIQALRRSRQLDSQLGRPGDTLCATSSATAEQLSKESTETPASCATSVTLEGGIVRGLETKTGVSPGASYPLAVVVPSLTRTPLPLLVDSDTGGMRHGVEGRLLASLQGSWIAGTALDGSDSQRAPGGRLPGRSVVRGGAAGSRGATMSVRPPRTPLPPRGGPEGTASLSGSDGSQRSGVGAGAYSWLQRAVETWSEKPSTRLKASLRAALNSTQHPTKGSAPAPSLRSGQARSGDLFDPEQSQEHLLNATGSSSDATGLEGGLDRRGGAGPNGGRDTDTRPPSPSGKHESDTSLWSSFPEHGNPRLHQDGSGRREADKLEKTREESREGASHRKEVLGSAHEPRHGGADRASGGRVGLHEGVKRGTRRRRKVGANDDSTSVRGFQKTGAEAARARGPWRSREGNDAEAAMGSWDFDLKQSPSPSSPPSEGPLTSPSQQRWTRRELSGLVDFPAHWGMSDEEQEREAVDDEAVAERTDDADDERMRRLLERAACEKHSPMMLSAMFDSSLSSSGDAASDAESSGGRGAVRRVPQSSNQLPLFGEDGYADDDINVRLRHRADSVLADLADQLENFEYKIKLSSGESARKRHHRRQRAQPVLSMSAGPVVVEEEVKGSVERDLLSALASADDEAFRRMFELDALDTYRSIVQKRDELRAKHSEQLALLEKFKTDISSLSCGGDERGGDKYAHEIMAEIKRYAHSSSVSLVRMVNTALGESGSSPRGSRPAENDEEEDLMHMMFRQRRRPERKERGFVEMRNAGVQCTPSVTEEEDSSYLPFTGDQVDELYRHERRLLESIRLMAIATRSVLKFHTALEVEATCLNCFYLIEQPRTLWPCGHTFCQQCLGDMYDGTDQLVCGVCGTPCDVGFTPNPSVELLANYQMMQSSGESRDTCAGCSEAIVHVLDSLQKTLLSAQRGC